LGGLIGSIESADVVVRNCFSTGNVAQASSSAGFIGYTWSAVRIENCYSLSNNVYGFANEGNIISCYFEKDRLSAINTDVKGRTTAQMKDINTFVDWDFDNVWQMEDDSYPYLRDMDSPY
jgi:hypothetical protein